MCVCVWFGLTAEHERHGGRDADGDQAPRRRQERRARLPAHQRRRRRSQLPATHAVQSAALCARHT